MRKAETIRRHPPGGSCAAEPRFQRGKTRAGGEGVPSNIEEQAAPAQISASKLRLDCSPGPSPAPRCTRSLQIWVFREFKVLAGDKGLGSGREVTGQRLKSGGYIKKVRRGKKGGAEAGPAGLLPVKRREGIGLNERRHF
ncbi:hypothetical protein SKAU_G00339640 [Synaphobranchus kaupii]|uniref:Uncharacterized protein n=1 Tax=Synaphobranchus kaupii TaxID=118154 RepID=A0A9Q1EMT6_SYNKA|nr:hypothetical protein SKAU_G00339640 [Synaphobranchus kaupii]